MTPGWARNHKPTITLQNLQRKITVNVTALQRFAESALALCLGERRRRIARLQRLEQISIVLISDRRMAALHQRFLNKAGATDVITFHHGEIFISTETARRHARTFGNSTRREIQLYIVHGLLHLQGFDDRNAAEAREMEATQKRVIGKISGDRDG